MAASQASIAWAVREFTFDSQALLRSLFKIPD